MVQSSLFYRLKIAFEFKKEGMMQKSVGDVCLSLCGHWKIFITEWNNPVVNVSRFRVMKSCVTVNLTVLI